MEPDDQRILGYDQLPDGSWEPFYECKKGYMYTAATVHCQQCRQMLRGMGGPLDALCVDCYNQLTNLGHQ